MERSLRPLALISSMAPRVVRAAGRSRWGPSGNAPGTGFLEGLINYGMIIAPLLIIIGLILGGILWAAGSENGPRRCMYAVIGGGVALLATGLGAFLQSIAH
jgi:hypothetical protein